MAGRTLRNPYAGPMSNAPRLGFPPPSSTSYDDAASIPPSPTAGPTRYAGPLSQHAQTPYSQWTPEMHQSFANNTPGLQAGLGGIQSRYAEGKMTGQANANTYNSMGRHAGYQSPGNASIVNPLIAQHQAQQERNGMTAHQRALVDAAPGFAAQQAAAQSQLSPGPRPGFIGRSARNYVAQTHLESPGSEAALNNVQGGGVGGVYAAASRKQALAAAAYKALLARRYGRGTADTSIASSATPGIPGRQSVGRGPNGEMVVSQGGMPPQGGTPMVTTPVNGAPDMPPNRVVPGMDFAPPVGQDPRYQGAFEQPGMQSFSPQLPPGQQMFNNYGPQVVDHYNRLSPMQWPVHYGLPWAADQYYGTQPTWKPRLGR